MSEAIRAIQTPAESIAELYRRVRDLEIRSQRFGRPIKTVSFISSGSFVKADHPGLRAVRIRIQGGGGAGGGRRTSPNGGMGGGGGGGGYAEKIVLAADLGASETVTVGAGGVGAFDTNGTSGEDSDFGALVSGLGGGGGTRTGGVDATPAAGAGGVATGHDILVRGQAGQEGRWDSTYATVAEATGGTGGSAHLGPGRLGRPAGATGAGAAGHLYGGGGSGALGASSAGGGGNGAKGLVIVELYF